MLASGTGQDSHHRSRGVVDQPYKVSNISSTSVDKHQLIIVLSLNSCTLGLQV